MTRCVLDTSVVVKWFSAGDEGDLDAALRLRGEVAAGTLAAVVPDLLIYELANALRFNPRLSEDDVRIAVETLTDLVLTVRGPEPEIVARAIKIAFESNVTVYDSTFLALAEEEGVPMVTADYRFCDRIGALGNVARLDTLYRTR